MITSSSLSHTEHSCVLGELDSVGFSCFFLAVIPVPLHRNPTWLLHLCHPMILFPIFPFLLLPCWLFSFISAACFIFLLLLFMSRRGWWVRKFSLRWPRLFRRSCATPALSLSLSACASGMSDWYNFWWYFGTLLFFIFFLFGPGFWCAPWPSTSLSGMKSSLSWTFERLPTPWLRMWSPSRSASWLPVPRRWGSPPLSRTWAWPWLTVPAF